MSSVAYHTYRGALVQTWMTPRKVQMIFHIFSTLGFGSLDATVGEYFLPHKLLKFKNDKSKMKTTNPNSKTMNLKAKQ